MSLVTWAVTVTAAAPAWMVENEPVTMATESALIVVESLAFADAEPPPETVTLLTCGELALFPTFTVTVMAG